MNIHIQKYNIYIYDIFLQDSVIKTLIPAQYVADNFDFKVNDKSIQTIETKKCVFNNNEYYLVYLQGDKLSKYDILSITHKTNPNVLINLYYAQCLVSKRNANNFVIRDILFACFANRTKKQHSLLKKIHYIVLFYIARVLGFLYKNKEIWLFADRMDVAQDNAETLYTYVKNNEKDKKIYFVLKKSSPDYARLKKEGFNLLDPNSFKYKYIWLYTTLYLSSHAHPHVTKHLLNPYLQDIVKTEFIFLQHGATKDDVSNWFNQIHARIILCCANDEYESIVQNSNYIYTSQDVKLTGFPRHDELQNKFVNYQNQNTEQKNIVIIPTWRSTLVFGKQSFDEKFNNFVASDYFQYWINFLSSDYLKNLAKSGVNIIFYPHKNTQECFNHYFRKHSNLITYKYLNYENINNSNIKDIIVQADILITDYSSIAMEGAYLQKNMLYYQFDQDTIFTGIHLPQKGYFDYHKDGFGAVCINQEQLINSIQNIIKNNYQNHDLYLKRSNEFFKYKDTKNCQRVFELLQKLT